MRLLTLFLALSVCHCEGVLPPHVQPAAAVPSAPPGAAKVVFLRPANSCEVGGYYTLATTQGRFLGNLYTEMRLEADLPPGAVRFVAWNAEAPPANGTWAAKDVAVAEAHLEAGRTYFLRFGFGEWNVRGPVGPVRWVLPHTAYVRSICPNGEAALLAVRPGTKEWQVLPRWLDDLTPVRSLAPTAPLDPGLFAEKVQLASARLELLLPDARALATVRPGDGVRIVGPTRP